MIRTAARKRCLVLDRAQVRDLSRLLGQLQVYLESEIECVLIPGEPDPKPEYRATVTRARRLWRQAEDFQLCFQEAS